MHENTHLVSPPITEVACAFVFARQSIDTMDFGDYWEARRAEYPVKKIHQAIVNVNSPFQVREGIPLRSWLISRDDSVVLQLQDDRFVFNWRLREGGIYPGFNADKDNSGILSDALSQFAKFCDWISSRTGVVVALERIELTKINVLTKGDHYSDTKKLGEILSAAKVFSDIEVSEPQKLQLRLADRHDQSVINTNIVIDTESVQIEVHCLSPATINTKKAFIAANVHLNKVFFKLFKDGLHAFGESDELGIQHTKHYSGFCTHHDCYGQLCWRR